MADDEYAEEYPQEAEAAKKAAGWRCECCGVVDGSLGTTRNGRRKGKPHIIYLTAAHLDRNDKRNPKPRLAALCPVCHAMYDHGRPERQQMVYQAIMDLRRREGR